MSRRGGCLPRVENDTLEYVFMPEKFAGRWIRGGMGNKVSCFAGDSQLMDLGRGGEPAFVGFYNINIIKGARDDGRFETFGSDFWVFLRRIHFQ